MVTIETAKQVAQSYKQLSDEQKAYVSGCMAMALLIREREVDQGNRAS